jgi:hypothetical protein
VDRNHKRFEKESEYVLNEHFDALFFRQKTKIQKQDSQNTQKINKKIRIM